MPVDRILQSRLFRGIIVGFGVGATALIVFAGGMAVGSRKTLFACKWDENYAHNFGDHAGLLPAVPPPFQGHNVGVHGVLGNVISVMDDSIVVQGKDGIERDIIIPDGTNVRRRSAPTRSRPEKRS
jgi:hypothetical protein